jgi:ribosomal protein L40E
MFCPNCGVENPDTAAECRRCHVPFHDEAHKEPAPEANAAGTICAKCETFNEPGVERCTTCGYPLTAGAAEAPPMDATPAQAHPAHDSEAAHDPAAAHAELHHEPHADLAAAAHPESHEAPAEEIHSHDDPGSTHMLEPVSVSDTPAEGTPSIAEELSALELSPEDARAARGEDATPPDGSAPVPPQTAEHKLDTAAFGDDDDDHTSVSKNPFDDDHEESTSVSKNPFDDEDHTSVAAPPVHVEPSFDHTPPAPMRIAPAARKAAPPPIATPPPPVPTPAPPAAAAPPAPSEKICPSCASVNLPNAKFCAECGTPFPKKAAAASAPPAPVPTPAPAVAKPAPTAVHEPVEERASFADHTPPQPRRAESLQAAMEHAADAHALGAQLSVHDHTPAEAQHIPVAEEGHADHHEVAAHEDAHVQSDFDPTRTDQAKADLEPEAHAAVEAEHTSEQPRLEIQDEHHEAAEAHHEPAEEHHEAAAPAHESGHPDSPEEGLSVSIEAMESVHPHEGAAPHEEAAADVTPAEGYATDAALADEHPLPEDLPLEESSDLAAQADALPEELHDPAPAGDEAPPEETAHEAAPAEEIERAAHSEHEHATHEEPAFAEAEGHDPLAAEGHDPLAAEAPAEEQPVEEHLADEQAVEEQPVEEAPAGELFAEETPAEEHPLDEAPAEEPLAAAEEHPHEEPLAEEPVASGEEQPYETAAAEPEAEPAPELAAAPYSVQLIVEQGSQAGTSFQLAYTENSVGSAGALVELGEDVHLAPHHATVLIEDDRMLLRDEGTANGVFLKLRLAGALEPGDQFIAGQRLFRFDGPVELTQSEGTPPFQGAPRPAGTPVRIVELLAGGKPGRTCHRAGPVIAVGKTGCDLNFGGDALLAARHAEIHLAEDGTASLLDLGNSESGVLMRVRNGASVELQTGDVLQLGGQTVRIEFEQAAEA